MKFRILLPLLLSIFLLQGCIGAAIVSTAALAVKSGTDPRTTGRQVDDTTLKLRVSNELSHNLRLKQECRIITIAYQGQILLIGQAPTFQDKQLAQQITAKVDGVRDIYNEIRIGHPISFSQISNDSWYTTKIRSQLLTNDKVRSGNIKVVTEDNEVFLLGLVTKSQGREAAHIASQTNGIKNVTTVFNYVK